MKWSEMRQRYGVCGIKQDCLAKKQLRMALQGEPILMKPQGCRLRDGRTQSLACQGDSYLGPFLLDAGLGLQEAKSASGRESEVLVSVSEASMFLWRSLSSSSSVF